jgi:hypothetical protein
MCHATGTNSEFSAECLVRTNRTSCIMLKVGEDSKLNSGLFPCSLRHNSDSVFVLSSLSSVDGLLCIILLGLLLRLLSSSKNLLSR